MNEILAVMIYQEAELEFLRNIYGCIAVSRSEFSIDKTKEAMKLFKRIARTNTDIGFIYREYLEYVKLFMRKK